MKIRFHRSSYRSFVVVLPNVKLEQFLFKKKKKKKKKVKGKRREEGERKGIVLEKNCSMTLSIFTLV